MINNWQRVRVRNKSLCDKTMNKFKVVFMSSLVIQSNVEVSHTGFSRLPYLFFSNPITSIYMFDSFNPPIITNHIERESIYFGPLFHNIIV